MNSQYKSLLISARTTVDELIALLLSCSNSKERVEQFSLYEVCTSKEQQRKLHPDDRPLQVQQTWQPITNCHFLIRRNPDYLPLSRRKVSNHSKHLRNHVYFGLFCLQFFWSMARPSISPSRPYSNLLQLSKSQTSLLSTNTQEESHSTKKKLTSRPVDTTSKDSKQVADKISASPSYADYENYFYI